MKIVFPILFFLSIVISSNAQTVFRDSIAPQIEFTEWIDNTKGMSVIKDRPIVLEFWSTWCGPCVAAIPHVNQLAKKYYEDITFISVNSYENKAIVEKFLLKNPMTSYVALDENKTLKKAFNVQTIPVTIIIDKNRLIRWRGITTELTNELLDTFLSKNIFKDVYKKGVILDQNYSVNSLGKNNYHLLIEYGDKTKGKGITTDFEDSFFLMLSNYEIYSILTTFSEWSNQNDDWRFKGNLPDNVIINVTIKSDAKIINEEDEEKIIKDVILRLADNFNFIIESSEETQEVWYIIPDASLLKKNLSVDQSLDVSVVDQTEEYYTYKNVFFNYLASSFSIRTKVKVEYNQSKPSLYYDLTIPKTNDILEMKKYLKEEYGIDLVKKNIKVKVKTAIFN